MMDLDSLFISAYDVYENARLCCGFVPVSAAQQARIQVDLQKVLIDYIQGQSREETRIKLQHLTRQSQLSAYKLCASIENSAANPYVSVFLESLGIPEQDRQRYIQHSPTLYSLIVELAWDKKAQCAELIEDLDATHTHSWFELFTFTGLSFGSILSLMYIMDDQALYDFLTAIAIYAQTFYIWFHHTFALTSNAPLLGLAWQTWLLLHLWYQVMTTGIKMHYDTRVMLCFQTLHQCVMIAKDLLYYASAATMTPLVASLLILAALLDLVQHCYLPALRYFQWRTPMIHLENYDPNVPTIEYTNAIKFAHHAFHDYQHSFNTAIFWTNFISLGLLVIILVVNVTFPPTLFLTLSCLMATWMVNFGKNQLTHYFNQQIIDIRQQELIQAIQFNHKEVLNIPNLPL